MKTSDLDVQTNVSSDDYIVMVNDYDGVPTTVLVSVPTLFSNTSINVHVGNVYFDYHATPAASNDTVAWGKVWFDSDYLYVATGNNEIKRVELSTW